jgi:short-subunit dehydrogenase
MKREQIVRVGAVAVVTGASSGIGKAVADELAGRGMHVYAIARSLPDYFQDSGTHQAKGSGFIRPVKVDVTDPAAMHSAIDRIIQTEGKLDCLFQAAGYGIAGAVEDTSPGEAEQQMKTNFLGSAYALAPVLRQMRGQRRGMIVQVGSVAGALPVPFQAYYSASKAALAALTLALGDEVRPWGIRCLLVQPGDTRTGFTLARILAEAASQSEYQEICSPSISKMEKDETNGMLPETVARRIVRCMCRRNPPIVYTPGFFNKAVTFLAPKFPIRLVRWVEALMYAKP